MPPLQYEDQLALLLHAYLVFASSSASSSAPSLVTFVQQPSIVAAADLVYEKQEDGDDERTVAGEGVALLEEFVAALRSTGFREEDEAYALCKRVALALIEYMDMGIPSKTNEPLQSKNVRPLNIWHLRPHVLGLLITLKQMMQSVNFQLHVQEPFFSQLLDESKSVEGRCATGSYSRLSNGDLILFNNLLLQEVKAVNRYESFEEMLKAEGLRSVLPGVESIAEGVKVYRRFYTEEKERCGGVLGIHVRSLPRSQQPMTILADILNITSTRLI